MAAGCPAEVSSSWSPEAEKLQEQVTGERKENRGGLPALQTRSRVSAPVKRHRETVVWLELRDRPSPQTARSCCAADQARAVPILCSACMTPGMVSGHHRVA